MNWMGLCLVASSISLIGCLPAVAPMGSSTVRVGAEQQADVLWLSRDDSLLRCALLSGKPTCKEAHGLKSGELWGLGNFTVQTGEQQDADVVWVLSDGFVHRCANNGGKPVCKEISLIE